MLIAFPCLLSELIISQHPAIINENEMESPKSHPLNFDYRLFFGTHVKDIEDQPTKDSGHPGLMAEPVKGDILSGLIDTSKALQDTIRICTEKKSRIDKLILQLKAEQEEVAEEKVEEEEPADKDKAEAEGGSEEEEEETEEEEEDTGDEVAEE